ncbi:MAG TPA: CbtA family protein [Pseudomonadales bacterium]|nr:CbtA family protein [Pseudomonadales bacterium]
MKTLIAPALLAGLLAALILTLVQAFAVTPLILEAETYEQAAEAAVVPATHHHDATAAHEHEHDENAWQPEDGWQRTLSTASANLLMGVGYALMLVSLYRFRAPQNALIGLAWGMAGYAVVFVAPAMGLHPELPGTAAAELSARQEWWTGTALATASGLALCVFSRAWGLKIVGLLLIGLPHFIGAPQPAIAEALAPEELQHRFIFASALVNATFWLALGLLTAIFFRKFSNEQTNLQDAANPA